MKKKNLLFFLIILFTLVSCQEDITGNVILENIPEENIDGVEVYFCTSDNCSDILINELKSAEESLYCAFYDIDEENIINVLEEKSKSIYTGFIVDKNYKDDSLNSLKIMYDDDQQYTHNKFCIIDNEKVITGSTNPTSRGLTKNNNNLIIIGSRYLAINYKDEFDELWSGNFGDGIKVKSPILILNGKEYENYFCPEDNCAEEILEELENAKNSIYFMTFSFTHDAIGDLLIEKHNLGLDIKGIFEKTQAGSKYSEYHKMAENGMHVIKDNNPYTMHHKVFIIDNSTVITGSMNPTASGDTKNDENILIIHDEEIAGKYLEEFDRLYG